MSAMPCNLCTHPAFDHSALAGCLADHCDCTETPGDIAMQTAAQATQSAPEPSGLAEGRRRRDAGAEAAGSAAPGALVTSWRVDAAKALTALIDGGHPFTADDLVERVGMPPVANMLGGTFIGASKAKRIKPVGYAQATRPESHARIQRIWQAVEGEPS